MNYHEHIGHKCKYLSILVGQTIGQTLSTLDLTPVQSRVLNYLVFEQEKNLCQRDVEGAFSLSHPTVSGILARLEEKDYITLRVDSSDRRRKRIGVTPKALESFAATTAAIEQVEAGIVAGFSPGERQQLCRLLDRAIHNLGGEPGKCFQKEENPSCSKP